MKVPLAAPRWRSLGPTGRAAVSARRAFSLTELLVVMLVIILLAGLVVGLAAYAQRKAKVSRATAEVAHLEGVIESFRSDRGSYPTSTTVRVSLNWVYEAINSMLLYQQLTNAGYATAIRDTVRVMSIGTNLQERSETILFTSCGVGEFYGVNALIDPWQTPYNYYCPSPRVTTPIVDNFPLVGYPCYSTDVIHGGQRNLASFDLWSYGPDRLSCAFVVGAWYYVNNPERAVDDIANFQ